MPAVSMWEAPHILWSLDGYVREFGVYAEDLTALCQWLLESDGTTVALESTGDYWQNLYVELISFCLEVVLANGKFTKNAKVKNGRNRLKVDTETINHRTI